MKHRRPAVPQLKRRVEKGIKQHAAQAQADLLEQHERLQLVAMFNAGHYVDLEAKMRLLVELYPKSPFVWKLMGAVLHMQGKEALRVMRKTDELFPAHADAHNNLGNVLRDLGQLDEAAVSYRRALDIAPNLAEAHSNLGVVLWDLGQLDEAAMSYRRALSIAPDLAEAHSNLGLILWDLGQLDEAVERHRIALSFKPDYVEAHGHILFTHNYLSGQPSEALLSEARSYGKLVEEKAKPYSHWPNAPDANRCIRVGFVSGDLRNHPVGHFVEGMLTALASDASGRLELFAYFTSFHSDVLTNRIKTCCNTWHSVVGLSDERLAGRIREDRIDILIDLSGHTAHNRLPMFAWKPAPVQVTWLGYFATTGVAAIDYLIADPWTLPATEEANFTEKIWRLPETRLCFTAPDCNVDVLQLPALCNGFITFGCFNNLTKMNDAVVALWALVLKAVPDSRLFLKARQLRQGLARQNVIDRFAAKGVHADRLILEGYDSRTDYLAAYNRVDIALDPFPFTGGTTSVEGLWMGVPVLTLKGERFLSRQGVGILMNVKLPDWIAADEDDYVVRAVWHSGNLQRLSSLRTGLRQQVSASPIFDAQRFARNFEAAMRGMWLGWCNEQGALMAASNSPRQDG
jgi:protein O-GlcNAc transferase